jgi:hypothetical protein
MGCFASCRPRDILGVQALASGQALDEDLGLRIRLGLQLLKQVAPAVPALCFCMPHRLHAMQAAALVTGLTTEGAALASHGGDAGKLTTGRVMLCALPKADSLWFPCSAAGTFPGGPGQPGPASVSQVTQYCGEKV